VKDGSKKILVVDDSEDVREFFAFVLANAHYVVDTAANGDDAFDKVQGDRPDLVVLDVVMPGIDGFGLMVKLRSDLAPPIPPIILCSGFDVTEDEALRRGAVRFVRKPVDPRDLLALVADVLAGRPPAAEALARERTHVGMARQHAADTARKLIQQIAANSTAHAHRQRLGHEYCTRLASYLGVDAVALSVLQDDHLRVVEASPGSSLQPGDDLGERLPPAFAILETGSSLVLPDAPLHPSFGPECSNLEGIRGFVGVPVAIDKTVIGVLCVLDARSVGFEPEDQTVVRIFAEECASVVREWAHGSSEVELPARFNAGVLPRALFEQMLDAELRLLDRQGGSMELAILSLSDLAGMGAALAQAASPERRFAGVLSDRRVAVYKRSLDERAGQALASVLATLRARAEAGAAGVVDLAVAGMAPFTAPDLIRLADLALDKTMQADNGGLHRLVISERPIGE